MKQRNNKLESPTQTRHNGHPTVAGRSGAILVVTLVILAIIGSMFGLMMKTITLHSKQIQASEYQHQSRWLADSAIERAVARKQQDDSYQGETWKVTLPANGKPKTGAVEIKLATDNDHPQQTLISVTVHYPETGNYSVQSKQQTWINNP